jgi:hypothetical protein
MGVNVSAAERLNHQEALTMNSTAPVDPDPMGHRLPVGHWPPRRTLPADLASALWEARANSRLPNWALARLVGIDASYLSKLVRGSRCPSRVVAEGLIAFLPLTEEQQEALRVVAVQDVGKSRPPG